MSEETLATMDCAEIINPDPIIHLTENGVEGFEVLCRLCANRSDHLIPIYSEEGVSNDLADKMNMYLPIKVTKDDLLPLQCCFQCATTVLTWHELVVATLEADRRLRDVQIEVEKQLLPEEDVEITTPEPLPGTSQEVADLKDEDEMVLQNEDDEEENDDDHDGQISSESASLSPFRQEIGDHLTSDTRSCKPTAQGQVLVQSSTDGDWIKSELMLEHVDVEPYMGECELTPELSCSEQNEFEELEEEFDDPGEEKVKPHGCQLCGKIFRRLATLKRHAKKCKELDTLKVEKLENEDDSNANNEDALAHSKPKLKREFRCDYCAFACLKKDEMRNHMQEDHPDKADTFSDKRRPRSKIDQAAVNRAKVVVDKRTYYHCNICGKNLHSPYTYMWHTRIHTGERPYVCDLCGKQFRVSQGLVRHLRETHAGIKKFPCDLCGRMFASRRNVEEHRRIHTNERPYICDLCGKAFKQKASLFVHNRSHSTSFPFKCSYCNQGFRTRPPLLVHLTRHTGEKPYACDTCGRCFRIKYELKRHLLIHSDDKPFSCSECGISFRQKRYLRNHNKINHNIILP